MLSFRDTTGHAGARMSLTERRIRDAAPRAATWILWDAAFKSFGVRIAPGGTKSYVLDFHDAGKHRRVTLARVGELPLKQARALASRQMAKVRAGDAHMLDRRREAAEAPTVADTVDRFLNDHAERRIANGRMKPRTVADYAAQCRAVILPALGAMPVAAVETADVERMVDPLKRVMRNRVLALASRIFTLAEHWGQRGQHTNPARGIERSVEGARDRVLSPAELEALAGALADRGERNPAAVAAIRFAAMTGLRIGEILAIQWEHLDAETGALLLPETKTGRRWHDLPAAAVAVLDGLPRINEWCFTNGRAPIGYKHTAAIFRAAAAAAGLENTRLHDLRRTVATRAAASGLGILELRALLGWKTTAMPARYVALAGDGIREHRRRIGDEVAALMEGGPDNILPLRRHG